MIDIKHQDGIGLSEILIALFLSSFVLLILMQHYLTIKKQYYHLQTQLEDVVERELVTELIRDSVRKAGFTPCGNIDRLLPVDQRDNPKNLRAINFSAAGQGSLQLNRMSNVFDTVLDISNPMTLLLTPIKPLRLSQSILIADCYHAEVQSLTEIVQMSTGQRVTLNKPLAFAYHAPIYVGEWLEERYFIRKNKQGKTSLFYQNQHAEELTTAIHSLSVDLTQQPLVNVILGLNDQAVLMLETSVRSS